MKNVLQLRALGVVAGFAPALLLAQVTTTFDSGSTGADGALDIPADQSVELPLPPDGILNFTTVSVAEGATLTFLRNSINTPVYMLCTGDVQIDGTIDVSGKQTVGNYLGGEPGPGGFRGGQAGFEGATGNEGGWGLGPGGSAPGPAFNENNFDEIPTVGRANYSRVNDINVSSIRANPLPNDGAVYGSPLLVPLIGGSGGGGADSAELGGGGGGGGAILIASNTEIVIGETGEILARGGVGGYASINFSTQLGVMANAGSGGAIRLVAPGVYGTGSLNVRARPFSSSESSTTNSTTLAGDGRIRIDSIFRQNPEDSSEFLGVTFSPVAAASVGGNMVAILADRPQLDILNVAGQAIQEGTTTAVNVQLSAGADPNQPITVQARNFDKVVPISIVITPDNGDRVVVDDEIDNSTATGTNPASKVINLDFPVNVRCDVQVWVRQELVTETPVF